ncbi:hypothetical protein C0J52_22307, partial [Blattella germanica]
QVEGKWNIGLGNKLVLDTYYNHHVFVIKVFDDKTTINGTVKQLPSAGGSTIAFNGGWKIPKNRSSTFVTGFSKDMGEYVPCYVSLHSRLLEINAFCTSFDILH